MRTAKNFNKRREEILDVIETLYNTKGYTESSVSDILNVLHIAKGTFYHYFKNKEETLNAIIDREVDKMLARILEVTENPNLLPDDKLMMAFLSMRVENSNKQEILDHLHQPDNSLMHQKQLSETINRVSPLLAKVIIEGNDLSIWKCRFPNEQMDIFLASALTLTDEGIFNKDEEYSSRIIIALISLLERMLNIEDNVFIKKFEKFMR